MTRMHEEYEVDEERLTNFARRLIGEYSPSGEERSVADLVAAERSISGTRSKSIDLQQRLEASRVSLSN